MPTERPLSPWHLPPDHPAQLFLTGSTPLFALTGDPRVSYCLYVPRGHSNTGEPRPSSWPSTERTGTSARSATTSPTSPKNATASYSRRCSRPG